MPKFLFALTNPCYRSTAIRVALIVGSALLIINHGEAIAKRKMNRNRWISAISTYAVPYIVSVHGQQSANRSKK